MTEIWWAPREIVFSQEQIVWLLQHLPSLDEGQWPPEPGGYDEVRTNKPDWWKGAPFEKPCEFGAEVRHRLEATGDDGLLVELHIVYESSLDHLARLKGLDEHQAARRIDRALRYMRGWSRKDKTYREWRGKRRRRRRQE